MRGLAYPKSQASVRIRSATGSLETSVERFREGLFNLVQVLISEQKTNKTFMEDNPNKVSTLKLERIHTLSDKLAEKINFCPSKSTN